jgi:pilus assembly protein FimV
MKSSRQLWAVATTLTAACSWSIPAWSLGLGQPESQAVLGDTLSVTVPLRLEAGETITQECVSAEVNFGDDPLPSGSVVLELQPAETVTAGMAGRLVLRTKDLINEPVVSVQVSAGCQARISRRFVVLADPPGHVPMVRSPQLGAVQLPPIDSVAQRAPPEPTRKTSQANGLSGRTGASSSKRASEVASARKKAVRQSQRVKPVSGGPRLALDPVDADALVQPSLRSSGMTLSPIEAAGAASDVQVRREAAAALWRALNATPEVMLRQQQHVEELEKRLQAVQRSGEQTQQSIAALQARMQTLEKPSRFEWGWPHFAALLAALLAVIAALGWLLHGWGLRKGRQQSSTWWSPETGHQPLVAPRTEDTVSKSHLNSGHDEVLGPIPRPDSDDHIPPVQAVAAEIAPLSESREKSVVAVEASTRSIESEPVKTVSVEELIDLEQQAEFFIVLGQDDAAVDLLEAHMGGHTQQIPWPYLKLMEIYRRMGLRADYERVQRRFNDQFNGHAPTWESDMEQGCSLVDYPGVIERLQALWAEPARAMDVLEMSLVHLGPDADAFDLPAYRELLFLYGVARDLADRAERRDPPTTDIAPLTATQAVRTASFAAARIEPISVDLDLDRLDESR